MRSSLRDAFDPRWREQQRVQSGGIGPVKPKASRRVVPVGQVVIDALAAHLTAYPTDGPLFLDELGEPLRYRRWRTLAKAAARKQPSTSRRTPCGTSSPRL